MINPRHYDRTDRLLLGISRALQTAHETFGAAHTQSKPGAARAFPAAGVGEAALSAPERRQAGRYMRVNHVGEVCAQALYRSQAMTARDPRLRARMQQAAHEEADHLAWCERRMQELGARKSLLNPLWWLGAFTIGGAAGLVGDRWNLGFVAETERQVVAHLESHLGKLPTKDARSRAVVAQMKQDENAHAEAALAAGAAELPPPVKRLMKLAAKGMTATAYWV